MNDIRVSRLAALSGAGFFVLGTIGHFSYPHSPGFMANPPAVQAFYAGHDGGVLASNTMFLLAGMLLLVFAGVMRTVLARAGETLATIAFGAFVAAGSLMIASAAIDMTAALHVQKRGEIGAQAASTLWDLSQVLFGLAAPMALAVAVLGVALATLRHRALPTWLGATSAVLGVALAIPPINYVSVVVFTFWALATSLVLALRDVPEAGAVLDPAPAAPPAR